MTVTQEFWVQILADTRFPPWNYFTGGSGNSVAPESVPGSSSRLYTVVVDAWILGNKGEESSDSANCYSLAVGLNL